MKTKTLARSTKKMADKEFGLLPLPPISNPFGSSRGPTTEIMWLPGVPSVVTIGTTSYAAALNITAASVANFSDYASVWEEYIVRAVTWEYVSCGTQNGVMKIYIDEADNTSPTATSTKKHFGYLLRCNGASGDRRSLKWVAKDTGDEQFRATSVTSAFITALKVYSDQSNYGLVGTAEAVAIVQPWICVQFRTQGGA